jgi:hypothetical protein
VISFRGDKTIFFQLHKYRAYLTSVCEKTANDELAWMWDEVFLENYNVSGVAEGLSE